VIITSRGEVVVAFRLNRRDVHVTRSNDGGRTFAPAVLIQAEPWYIEGCPGTGPSIVCDSTNTLHITWRDARDPASPGSLFYAQLPDGSTQTPPNMFINPPLGTDGEYPVVATDRTGASVGIVWFANDGVWQLLRNGAEMKRTALSTRALENPGVHIVWHGTGFLVIWQDVIDGVADLRMVRTDLETSVRDDHDADTSTPWMYVDLLGRMFTHPPYAGWWMRVRPVAK
jgi:hypothetical protein